MLIIVSAVTGGCTSLGGLFDGAGSSIENLQNQYRSIASTVMPAVVEVRAVEIITGDSDSPQGIPLDEFIPDPESEDREYRSEGLGSGFIFDKRNRWVYVVTNSHVIRESSEIYVTLYNGKNYDCTLVGKDERKDIAVLEFECDPDDKIVTAELGDSSKLQLGDIVMAIGSPYGLEFSVSAGIVSGLNRRSGPQDNINDFIQTDAAINKGNSGGPLINIYGQVVGINTWIISPSGGNVSLGFTIPTNNIKGSLSQLITDGKTVYGYFGVILENIDERLLSSMHDKTPSGALVTNVIIDSPAYEAGVLPGDIIMSINEKNAKNKGDVIYSIGELFPGDTFSVLLSRNGTKMELKLEADKRPRDNEFKNKGGLVWPGFSAIDMTDELSSLLYDFTSERGVLVYSVIFRSPAYNAGLREGDFLRRINDEKITTVAELYTRNFNDEATYVLEIEREEETIQLELQSGE